MTSIRIVWMALAYFAATDISHAAELAPSSAYSIRLSGFQGVVYHTIEHDGYRVVATLTSGAEASPIRFVSTLRPGQRAVISVPQAVGQRSVDFEIIREGDALLVSEPVAAKPTPLPDKVEARAASGK